MAVMSALKEQVKLEPKGVLILIISAHHLPSDLLQLAKDVDSRLDLLGVLFGWVFQPDCVALPFEVGYYSIDQS